jgi:capsular exopolysaccharide synthesis family protein
MWQLAGFVAACLLATFLISSRLQPIYEATVTINIDRKAPTGVVGDEAQRETSAAQDADQYLATQMKIIQSDAVLRPVADRFKLLRREHQLDGLSPNEAAKLEQSPTTLKQLHITRPPNTYLVHISYRSTDPRTSADVANAIAQSYLEHIYRIQIDASDNAEQFMEKQLDELKAKMERSSQALAQFERELNVINPEQKTNIISARLLQLNTEYTNAQADRVRKEAIYDSVKTGSLAAAQISGQGEDLQKLLDRLGEAEENLVEIRSSKGPNHPESRKAESKLSELRRQVQAAQANIARRIDTDFRQSVNRERILKAAVAETKAEFDQLNMRSFDYQRLKQEADADKRLYEELTTKIREAAINAGFQNRNTAISDQARPEAKPVFPKMRLNVFLAGLLSSFLGIAAIILIDALDTTVRDPEQVIRMFNTDLLAALPMVKDPKALQSAVSAELLKPPLSGPDGIGFDTERDHSHSSFEEAIRMLRNSILLSDLDRRLRSLLFTSATPGEGKSTIAARLAIAHAQQGKKTLLIDADLRRPTLQKKFGIEGVDGLSSVLTGACCWEACVREVPNLANLHVLPAGPSSRRAADLVGPRIEGILDDAGRIYDLIIVDGPPLLGFAEPMELAIAVDGVVVIAVAAETNRKAIAAVIGTLQRLKANVLGIVLNRTTKNATSGYYYYTGYDRYYHNYAEPQNSRLS